MNKNLLFKLLALLVLASFILGACGGSPAAETNVEAPAAVEESAAREAPASSTEAPADPYCYSLAYEGETVAVRTYTSLLTIPETVVSCPPPEQALVETPTEGAVSRARLLCETTGNVITVWIQTNPFTCEELTHADENDERNWWIDCVNRGINNGTDARTSHQNCGHPEWWPQTDTMGTEAPATEAPTTWCVPGEVQTMDFSTIPIQLDGQKVVGASIISLSLVTITWEGGSTDTVMVEGGNTIWMNNATKVTITAFPCEYAPGVEDYAQINAITLKTAEEFDEDVLLIVPDSEEVKPPSLNG